jgi:beta-lactamase regulating signal transducer with metallopeptidase domain
MDLIFIKPELAEAIGWTLIHSLWQGALVFMLLAPLLTLFKDHTPQLRYNLLCLGLMVFLAGMITTFYLSLPEPLPSAVWTEQEIVATNSSAASMETPEAVHKPAPAVYAFSLRPLIHKYAGYLVRIWLLGGLLFGLRWMTGIFYTRRFKTTLVRDLAPEWQEQVNVWCRKLGIHRSVRLLESAKVEVPLIIGHFKPYILLPIGTVNGLSPQQIEAILVHELAHIKRHDFLVNLLLSGLEIILFYHPLYWWIANRIHQEREKCCDDIAVSACGNPRLYARTLLLMEEKRQQKTLAMTYQGKKHHLLDRIKRICSTTTHHRFEFGKAGLSFLLLLAAAAISWAQLPAEPAFETAVETITELEHPILPTPEPVEPVAANIAESLPPLSNEPQEPTGVTEPSVALPSVPSSRTTILNIGHRPQANADTIPYTANIPEMQVKPTLTQPPAFPFTKDEVLQIFTKEAAERSGYRAKIDQYYDQLKSWKEQTRQQYLQPWDQWQDQVKSYYQDWKTDLDRKSQGDQLAYHIAVNKGSRQFSEALSAEESAIRNSENSIKADIEEYIRGFEDALRTAGEQRKDHDERMAVHDDRMRIHDIRMTIHDVRMTIHDARMGIHDTRMDFHDDRMAAHDFIIGKFEKELFDALAADGLYVRDSKKDLTLVIDEEKMTVNGQDVSPQQYTKYGQLIRKYGFDYSREAPFVVKINDKMYQIGNSMHITK